MMKWTVGDTLAAMSAKNATFERFLEKEAYDVSLYKLEGIDTQTPHARDELYIIASGTGSFICAGETASVAEGDLLFVPTGVAHHFENFSEGFSTWVIFFGPRPAKGGD